MLPEYEELDRTHARIVDALVVAGEHQNEGNFKLWKEFNFQSYAFGRVELATVEDKVQMVEKIVRAINSNPMVHGMFGLAVPASYHLIGSRGKFWISADIDISKPSLHQFFVRRGVEVGDGSWRGSETIVDSRTVGLTKTRRNCFERQLAPRTTLSEPVRSGYAEYRSTDPAACLRRCGGRDFVACLSQLSSIIINGVTYRITASTWCEGAVSAWLGPFLKCPAEATHRVENCARRALKRHDIPDMVILSISVAVDPHTNLTRPFVLVKFRSMEAAHTACKAFSNNQLFVDGALISLAIAKKRGAGQQQRNQRVDDLSLADIATPNT